jgi:hypothetical protein
VARGGNRIIYPINLSYNRFPNHETYYYINRIRGQYNRGASHVNYPTGFVFIHATFSGAQGCLAASVFHNESFQTIGYATTGVSEGQYNFDDDDIGFKIFGGYNFGFIPLLDLAVEGSYVDFGQASSSGIINQEVDVSGWDVFGLAALNLGPIGVFGKVGH